MVKRALTGDHVSFALLVERYRNAVYGLAFHHLGRAEDAQDVAQETFIQAWLRLRQLHDAAKFAPWLHQITVNACHARQRQRRTDALPETLTDTDDMASRVETRLVVETALACLSAETRLTLTLFYTHGRSLAEIAGFLNVPVTTIKSRLRDARTRLRKELMPIMKERLTPEPLPTDFTVTVMHHIKADGAVYCLAFSPDGSLLAHETFGTAGDQYGIGDVYLRDVVTGAVRATLPLKSYITGLSWLPDGKTLIFGCYLSCDSEWASDIRLWRWETGELQTLALVPNGLVRSVALSPDGKRLATGTSYKDGSQYWGEAGVWDLDTGTVLWSASHLTQVLYVVFSPDGRRLATNSGAWESDGDDWSAGDVKLWEAATGRCLRTLEGPNALADSNLAFSPDGKKLAAAYEEKRSVLIWNTETGKRIRTLMGHEGRIAALTFSPDGRLLATGGIAKIVRLWDARRGTVRETLTEHEQVVHALAFTPDGKTLVSADIGGVVKFWQLS